MDYVGLYLSSQAIATKAKVNNIVYQTAVVVGNPRTSLLLTYTDSNATTASRINAWVQGKYYTGGVVFDELEADPIHVNAACPVTGTINFVLSCPYFFKGNYLINYTLG
jgi:hypothetical protein